MAICKVDRLDYMCRRDSSLYASTDAWEMQMAMENMDGWMCASAGWLMNEWMDRSLGLGLAQFRQKESGRAFVAYPVVA